MADKPKLKAEFVNPFLRSVYDIVTTMLGSEISRGKPALSQGATDPDHMMAMIDFTGAIKGMAALSMPRGSATKMVSKLVGMEIEDDDDNDAMITDGLSELVNMVAGSAKTDLSTAAGETLDLSLPCVVIGREYRVSSGSNTTWLDVPFKTDMGEFTLRIAFERT